MIATRRTSLGLIGSTLLSAPAIGAARAVPGVINLNDPPYNCGPGQSSAANRDAIARAIEASPPNGVIVWSGTIYVAPGPEAYIKFDKGLVFKGLSHWSSAIVPDPDIPSRVPVFWAHGAEDEDDFFHVEFKNFRLGDILVPREGGTGILVEASRSDGGTENSLIQNVYIHAGQYDDASWGIELIHSTEADFGPIYNFTIERCQVMGGLRCKRIADSVRVLNSLWYGENCIDIDCRPTEGQFTFFGNNVSNAGGFRLRTGNNVAITNNIFTQQVHSTSVSNAVVDLDGDVASIYSASLMLNRIHKEATHDDRPITARLLRCDNIRGLMLSHNTFANPLPDAPIEFTARCWGAELGINAWELLPNVPKFINLNANTPVLETIRVPARP
jgi:hypothetical protein